MLPAYSFCIDLIVMYFHKTPEYKQSEEEQYNSGNHKKAEKDYEKPQIYQLPKLDYVVERELSNQDFSNRVPAKQVSTFGNSYAGSGLLGFTYLHGPEINLNRDRVYSDPLLWLRVSNHEARHWDDEYATRCIEEWMVDFKLNCYKKNKNNKKTKTADTRAVKTFTDNYWNKKVA